ncbi:ABC transporter [Microbacterium sp.]|uniref:ABC transporter n=1 Tax=Microbacterium sp. TaxID=51671 RepID=UPI0025F75D02|nr:ABC transporter [Microbacterium sp.]
MSDPKYGEPVEETPTPDAAHGDDVVGRVNESLAEAEAASRDAVDESVRTAPPAAADEPAGPVASESAGNPLYRGEDLSLDYAAASQPDAAHEAPAESHAEVITPSEPVALVAAPTPQPIFVQAPEPPRPRGNRTAAGLIGLLAAIVFGILYLAASLALRGIAGVVSASDVGTEALSALTAWWFWVPVVVFFIAFWLLGAVINRGRWGHWVIFGLLVGVASYGGHVLGQLFQAPFWSLTASEGADLVQTQLLAPLAIAAFVLGREITIWFGAWVAVRGARVTEINNEAQREYERTLEAGPRLHQS